MHIIEILQTLSRGLFTIPAIIIGGIITTFDPSLEPSELDKLYFQTK